MRFTIGANRHDDAGYHAMGRDQLTRPGRDPDQSGSPRVFWSRKGRGFRVIALDPGRVTSVPRRPA
jgi:hypothetical protein